MANPISQIPGAQLPPITEAIADKDGHPTIIFHRFMTGLFLRTGGAAGVSAGDAAAVADQAIKTATQASSQAQHAQLTANQANATANAAIATSSAANTTANTAVTSAQTAQSASLQRFNNLGDLLDASVGRHNLGVDLLPCVYQFDTLPANLRRGVPLVYNGRIETNLAGTRAWWNTASTSDAVFIVSYVRNGIDTRIGTITLVNHGSGVQLSIQAAVNLLVGDTLVVQCPSVPDSTLAQVAITIPLTI